MTIKVECIQASQCAITGQKLFTLICEYPLDVHAQLLTHGALSKNSSSCRAIPIGTACDNLRANPAKKIWTGKQAGMQGKPITSKVKLGQLDAMHGVFLEQAISNAKMMEEAGVHKQNAGRYLSPFQNIKIVLSGTDWENWDWLRNDPDAQPEIQQLARMIIEARESAEMFILNAGEYHVPYVHRNRNVAGELEYFRKDMNAMQSRDHPTAYTYTKLAVSQAIELSQSCCAQTSYRKEDTSAEKTEDIIGKLFKGHKVHASPTEHQATPIDAICHGAPPQGVSLQQIMDDLPEGITALDRRLQFKSGNFTNWIQQRQLIEGHDHRETLLDQKDDMVRFALFAEAVAAGLEEHRK